MGKMPDLGAINQAEISAILVFFRPVPGPRLEKMPPTMMAYPPKVALNSGESSAHQILNVRLIFIILIENVLTPPPKPKFWNTLL